MQLCKLRIFSNLISDFTYNSKIKLFKHQNWYLNRPSNYKIETTNFWSVPALSHYLHTSISSSNSNNKPFDELSPSQIDYINKLELEKNKSKLKTSNVKNLLDHSTTHEDEQGKDPTDVWHKNPYESVPKEITKKMQMQGNYFLTPKLQSDKTSIVLFPGQGTQFVGMAKPYIDNPIVKELYGTASEILGYDLLKLSLEGPAHLLNQTEYQQPAIFVASLASVEKIRQDYPENLDNCIATAGFSLGEITALTFSGAIPFESALKLVKVRAEAMQIASDMNPSGMMTVFYGADAKLSFTCHVAMKYCQKLGLEEYDCRIASYLFPSCKVVAGNNEALNFIKDNREDFKIRKIKPLDVSGAFHTDLMASAVPVLKQALVDIPITKPRIPVYSNVDGKRYKNAAHIKTQLPKQIQKPVKWEQVLHVLYERPKSEEQPNTFACGPGKSMKTLVGMNNARANIKTRSL